MKKHFSALLSLILAFTNVCASAEVIYERHESSNIARGITYESVDSYSEFGWTKADIIKVDMTDESVSLQVMTAPGGSSSLATVKQMAETGGAKAAVNADFFNFPTVGSTETNMLGMVVHDGELVSSPAKDNLVSFALTEDDKVIFDYFTFSGKIIADNTSLCDYYSEFEIYQVNKMPLTTGHITMITSAWGESVSVPADCYAMICSPSDESEYKVTGSSWGGEKVAIPAGGAVFIANYSINGFLNANFAEGDIVKVELSVSPDIGAIKEATGGNTLIVKDGAVADFTGEIKGKSQRTAAGISKSGKTFVLVTIDGRQSDCAGMTQTQLAEFMIALGCDSAINLDGGGSTTMVVENRLDSSLSVKNDVSSLRKVSTSIGVFSDLEPTGEIFEGEIALSKDTIILGDSVDASAAFYDESYTTVNKEITYSCSDPYAVITGSRIMPTAPGTVTVTAECDGKMAAAELTVIDDIFAVNLYPESIDTSSSDCKLSVTAYDRNGLSAVIPNDLVTFSADGNVTVSGGTVKKGSGQGSVTASYNSLTSTAAVNAPYYSRATDNKEKDKFEGVIPNAVSFTVAGNIYPKKLIGLRRVNRALSALSESGDIYALSEVNDTCALLPSYRPVTAYTERIIENTRVITFPNSESASFRLTDSASWAKFKASVNNMTEKNLIIMTNSPTYMMTKGEKAVFEFFLDDLYERGINVFVLSTGVKSEVTVSGGVRYIYLGPIGEESIDSYDYDRAVNTVYRFTFSGDDIMYQSVILD